MDFSLTEEQVLLRDSAREFLDQEWPIPELRRMLDASDSATAAEALWRKIADLGWPGLLVSEENEGLGLGLFDLAVLMEETGRRLIPGTLPATGILAALALETLGDAPARRRHLPGIADGSLRATVGVYEAGSGWTPADWRIGGGDSTAKRYVPNAAEAGLLLFLNPTGNDSVELAVAHEAECRDLHSMDVTRPLFEVVCRTADLERIGEGSLEDLQSVLDKATIALAAEMVGGAAQLLDMTVDYAKSRKQFGRAIGTFQAVQHKAADMLIGIEKARTAVYYAAAVADERPDSLAEASSIAKSTANAAFVDVAEKAIQLHGGLGFTWEQDLHLYLKRAKACEFTLGDTKWHLDRIARGLGLP